MKSLVSTGGLINLSLDIFLIPRVEKIQMRRTLALLLITLLPVLVVAQTNQIVRSQTLVFTHVNLIDMTGAKPKPDRTLIIVGNRIAAIGKTGKVREPKDAQVINATGKYLIPGLWDMHVHLTDVTELALPLLIANGVTGVRDVGGDLSQIDRWRKAIADQSMLGPRIVRAGPFVDGPKRGAPFRLTVTNAEEAREAVRSLEQQSVDLIKVHNGISREAFFALMDEANKQGVPVGAHLPPYITPTEASNAGVRSVEHTGLIMEATTNNALRGGKSVRDALAAYTDDQAAEVFRHFTRNRTWTVPTLVAAWTSAYRADIAAGAADPRGKYIATSTKQFWDKSFPVKTLPAEITAAQKLFYEKILQIVGIARREGVAILAGTDLGLRDVYPGFSLHDELGLLVKTGYTPMEALQSATRNPAQYLGKLNSLGTVENGKIADLMLLDANPLEDISNTKKIVAVVVNGRYLSKESLQKLLADVEAAANKR